jgi:hypothetical protein
MKLATHHHAPRSSRAYILISRECVSPISCRCTKMRDALEDVPPGTAIEIATQAASIMRLTGDSGAALEYIKRHAVR